MKIRFRPITRYGRWSVKFSGAFLGLYLLSVILVGLTIRHEGDVVSLDPAFRPFIMGAGISALLCGLSAFGTGLFSIIKEKERSIFVFLSVFIGTLALIFVLGEILIPH